MRAICGLWPLTGLQQAVTPQGTRELGIRPLIKHRIFAPYDYAHNARIDERRYNQRSMTEAVNSAIKRSLGFAVRARTWFREPREMPHVCRL